jgi:putative NADPH-quinone reductase
MENKKMIALSCSPSRKRNSDTMLDSFIEGVSSVSGIEVEKIYLEDVYIERFNFNNRLGPTEAELDFANLTQKIKSAEALIIATPTYNFSVPSHLKNFIDRIRFFALNMDKKNFINQPVGNLGSLKTYFIVSGGTPNWAQKMLFFAFPPFWLRSIFLYYGAHVLGAFYTGNVSAFSNKRILNKVKRKGVKFAKQVRAGKNNRVPERIFFRPPQLD